MKELETLLNTLIKMGWKPFGMEIHAEYIDRIVVEGPTMHIIFKGDGEYIEGLRALVSQESGLWQFVCDNELIKQNQKQRVLNPTYGPEGADCDWSIQSNETQHRLIESALVPEEDLAQFLVDNIRIEGNSKSEIR